MRAAGSNALCPYNALDCLFEVFGHGAVVGTSVDEQLCGVRDDVGLSSRLNRTNGHHCGLGGRYLTRDNGLKAHHNGGCQDNGIDTELRHGSVGAITVHSDLDRECRGENWPAASAHITAGQAS